MLFQRIQTKDCCCPILQTLSKIFFPSVLLHFYSFLFTWILHLELRVLCFTTGPGGCRANYSLISNYPTPPPSFSKELRIRIYTGRIRTQHLEKKSKSDPVEKIPGPGQSLSKKLSTSPGSGWLWIRNPTNCVAVRNAHEKDHYYFLNLLPIFLYIEKLL